MQLFRLISSKHEASSFRVKPYTAILYPKTMRSVNTARTEQSGPSRFDFCLVSINIAHSPQNEKQKAASSPKLIFSASDSSETPEAKKKESLKKRKICAKIDTNIY